MFTLDNTTTSLEVVLAGAITTNQLPIVVSFADKTTTTFTPGKTTSATNSTSTVTIAAAPAASTQREVHSINIYNADTVAAIITVRENDNGTLRILVKITLSVGDTLTYTHAHGWVVTDSSGNWKTVPGLVVLTSQVTGVLPVANGGTSLTEAIPPACGRLTFVSTTAIKFAPYNGDLIKINGALFQIPSAGIAGVANTSVFVNGTGGQNLAASTLYYVYAFSNSGTVTADFSTTTHATSSTAGNVGVEVKSGDDTRTLVGMIRTNGSSQFADSLTQRFTVSWFNRRLLGTMNVFTANRALATSAAWAEINTEVRVEFITWAEEAVVTNLGGGAFLNVITDQIYIALAFDGTTPEEGSFVISATLAIISVGLGQTKNGLAEGYHYATVLSFAQSGTGGGSIHGTATAGKRTGLSIGIRG